MYFIPVLAVFVKIALPLERFSYVLEMKKRKQNRNNERTEIVRFDWFIERIQTRVAVGWLSERSGAVLFFEPSILTQLLKQDSLFKDYLKEKFILEITKAVN